jgi:hypothetical protein
MLGYRSARHAKIDVVSLFGELGFFNTNMFFLAYSAIPIGLI